MRTNKKKISFEGNEIPRILLIFLFFILMSLVISAGNQNLRDDLLRLEQTKIGNQRLRNDVLNSKQTTTGEYPPPGIDLEGHVFDKLHLQAATVISGVPVYIWRHGCGPTAVGMILGYYDAHGFSNLIEGDAFFQGENANSAIASIQHYHDYCLPLDYPPMLLPDKSELPVGDEHSDNCIADYMKTSQSYSGNYYGWSWGGDIYRSFEKYVSSRSKYLCKTEWISSIIWMPWESLKEEIKNKRPLCFLVDSNGDGETDHAVPVVGYNSEYGVNYYGCYNTWDRKIHWYEYRGEKRRRSWGVAAIITFEIRPGIYSPKDFNLERLENNLIFFKEYINRVSWSADERNEGIPLESILFRKLKGASDATYQLISTFDGTDVSYDDRGLKQLDYYTYKVIFRDPEGRESDPAVVSN